MIENYTLIWSFRNRFDIFQKSIETADKFTPKDVDFCLVDAASEEETIKQLRIYCNTITDRKIRICESAYRSSLSEAWNLGMMLTNNRYAIFASSDVIFKSSKWFEELKACREQTESQYILIDNHAVFLIDKSVIPILGWMDEEFGIGPHFDSDYLLRAYIANIKVKWITSNGHYVHLGDAVGYGAERAFNECPNRLPMNTLENEIYWKTKWASNWKGWKHGTPEKKDPPLNPCEVVRIKEEIDPHPIYTKKCDMRKSGTN